MKQVTPFVISEFTNPSGKIVFQLYARIDGQRFRKNFQTRAEAEAERQVQEVSWLQRDTGTMHRRHRSPLLRWSSRVLAIGNATGPSAKADE